MKILVDLQSCQSGSRFGGIGRYSAELVKAMIRQGKNHEFYLMINANLPNTNEVHSEFSTLVSPERILTINLPSGTAEILFNSSRSRLAELVLERFISDLNPDIFYVTSFFEGFSEDVITSIGKIFPASRTAVTLYDLIPLAMKEQYLTTKVFRDSYFRKLSELRNAGIILAISEYSREEAVTLGDFDVRAVTNVSSAVDDFFRPRKVSDFRKSELFKKHGIQSNFIMYVSSFDLRKNHRRLIEAFSLLSRDLQSTHQLLIVGNGCDRIYNEHLKLAQKLGVNSNRVRFTERVSDDDLIDLYNTSSLFVFPSLREGFGLPVLEAMSCGVPTIGSNTTSLPEVLGRIDASFDPTNTESIAKLMTAALTDLDFRKSLMLHAVSHASKFSWDLSARRALEFMEQRIAEHRLSFSKLAWSQTNQQDIYKNLLNEIALIPNISNIDKQFILLTATALEMNEIIAGQVKASSAGINRQRKKHI
jgi:glycosyltransferase involved in cell wall biosynthesis